MEADDQITPSVMHPTEGNGFKHRQPTTEQLLIARLIDGKERISDAKQRQLVRELMDSTKKLEDMVHTALFDADWDVNAAFDILMEQPNIGYFYRFFLNKLLISYRGPVLGVGA